VEAIGVMLVKSLLKAGAIVTGCRLDLLAKLCGNPIPPLPMKVGQVVLDLAAP
jgi:hypothetical protein